MIEVRLQNGSKYVNQVEKKQMKFQIEYKKFYELPWQFNGETGIIIFKPSDLASI